MLERLIRLRTEGKAVVIVAVDGKAAGFISLGDTVRDNAKEALAQLRKAGIEPCLLTGDHEETAKAVAAELGILGPVSSAIVHNCTSVFVAVNAALLYDRKFRV